MIILARSTYVVYFDQLSGAAINKKRLKMNKKMFSFIFCLLLKAVWHAKAGRAKYEKNVFLFFSVVFVDFSREITEKGLISTKKVENGKKKLFNQFSGAAST